MHDPNWRDADPDFDEPTELERKLAHQPWYQFKQHRKAQRYAQKQTNDVVRSLTDLRPEMTARQRYGLIFLYAQRHRYHGKLLREDLYKPQE